MEIGITVCYGFRRINDTPDVGGIFIWPPPHDQRRRSFHTVSSAAAGVEWPGARAQGTPLSSTDGGLGVDEVPLDGPVGADRDRRLVMIGVQGELAGHQSHRHDQRLKIWPVVWLPVGVVAAEEPVGQVIEALDAVVVVLLGFGPGEGRM